MIGQVYAIEQPAQRRVYVGQTIRGARRITEHRKKNRFGLFDTEPTVMWLGEAEQGDDLCLLEQQVARAYGFLDWEVVSNNEGRVGWPSHAMSESARAAMAERGRHPDNVARLQAGSLAGGAVKGGIQARDSGRLQAQASRAGKAVAAIRRQCGGCGMIASPGTLGKHQRASGHVGYATL